MRLLSLSSLSSLAALGGLVTACATAPTPVRRFAPDDRADVERVLADQAAAWNRGDLAGYMAGYAKTPSLIFTSGSKVRRGWQTAFDHYRARYGKDPSAMGNLRFEIQQVDSVGADGAVVLGTWILTDTKHAGSGVFSVVFERRPEGWRIIHDHTSAAAPAS
ncbi:MAG: nuclear transport factor 2 family protein [Kofleriaceae bacterium]